jgi:hypothetical protein
LLTRNDRELVAVPAEVVTVMGPVPAPLGTVARIDVSEMTENVVAVTPLNVTLLAPVKCVPVIDTLVPTGPLVGENDEIVGAAGGVVVMVKAFVLVPVPPLVVTAIGPVVAPLGTVALIAVSEATENVVAVTPLKVILPAPLKPVPTIDTLVPTAPLVGVNDEIVGAVGGGEVEPGVTANSQVRQEVDDVVPPARLYWLPSQTFPTLPPAAGSGLAAE